MLEKTNIPVIFKGLDTGTASQLSVPGSFLVLENCVRRKLGKVQKRFGFSSLGKLVDDSDYIITQGNKVDTFGRDLLMLNNDSIFSYSSGNERWLYKGPVVSIGVENSQILRNSASQSTADVAYLRGLSCYVWEDSRGGVRYSVIDDSTGASIVYDVSLNTAGTYPKVVALRDVFVIMYIDGTDLMSRTVPWSAPATISVENTFQGSVVDAPWDMVKYSDTLLAFAVNTSGDDIKIGYGLQSGLVGNGTNGAPAPAEILSPTSLGTEALTLIADPDRQKLYVIYYDSATSTTEATVTGVSANLVTMVDGAITTTDIVNITGALQPDGTVFVFCEQAAADTYNQSVVGATVTWTGFGSIVVSSTSDQYRSVGLATKAFYRDGYTYVGLVHDSNLQPTYFLGRSDFLLTAKVNPGLAGGLTAKSSLPAIVMVDEDTYFTPLQIRINLQAEEGGVLSSNTGLQKSTFQFNVNDYNASTLGQNYHIAGGIMLAYDGVSAVEQGFHLFPENLSSAAAAGGALAANTYNYRVIYEWIDARGQVHRSAPSITVTQAATLNQKITITVPTLRLTQKVAPRAPVRIVLYRAAAGLSTVYYRMDTTGATVAEIDNDVTVDSVDLVDAGVGFSTSNEILYTTGGILENIAPPACRVIHKHKNRLFIAGLEDADAVVYSKEHIYGEGVQFTDAYRPIRTAPGSSAVSAMGTLDDKLIIFKQDRTFAMVGEGPLDTGAQDDYLSPVELSGEIGCAYPRSVITMPLGLMFKSDKGIYLLNRALTFEDIGTPVQDFNDLTITSATIIEDDNEVRFTTSDGVCLVYNYHYKEWSTFTNYEAVSACNALGSYVHLKADGTVNREDRSSYLDNGGRIKMALETSWFSFAGLQGYQRIYYIAFLGDFVSHHYTQLKIAYNFENVYNEQVYYDTRTGQTQETYGDDIYGDQDPYGGTGSSVYQFSWKPRIGKCESVKVRMEDIDTLTANGGGSFNLVAMSFTVGVKSGLNRMGASKTIGGNS